MYKTKKHKTRGMREWSSGIEMLKDPTKLGENSPTLYVPRRATNKIEALSYEMENIEWGGYLIGEGNQVDELVIPKQTVTGTHWENTGEETFENILGTVHSHHNMKATPSTGDTDYIGATYDYMCIYSHQDGVKGWKKVEVEENKYTLFPVNVVITGDEVDGEWIEEAKGKIKERKTTVNKQYKKFYDGNYKSGNDYCTQCGKKLSKKEVWSYGGYCSECINKSLREGGWQDV